jgi:ABC-2 type transport system ATP-binding protein
MTEMVPAVEIRNLVKDFTTSLRKQWLRAVDGLSIRMMTSEAYGLIGPNGAVKSTTIKAQLGLTPSTFCQGSIFGNFSRNIVVFCRKILITACL